MVWCGRVVLTHVETPIRRFSNNPSRPQTQYHHSHSHPTPNTFLIDIQTPTPKVLIIDSKSERDRVYKNGKKPDGFGKRIRGVGRNGMSVFGVGGGVSMMSAKLGDVSFGVSLVCSLG